VRVHDVQSTKDALAVVSALRATAMGTPLGRQGLSKLPGSSATVNENGPVISLTGIEAFGRHGVFDFEREQGQMFGVDVQLTLAQTPQADMLSETIDYSAVTTAIANLVSGEPVDLIETLAERICVEVLNNYPCIHVQVTVHKPQAPLSMSFTDVAVTTARSR
jgi:dihydroneopterin aldolase